MSTSLTCEQIIAGKLETGGKLKPTQLWQLYVDSGKHLNWQTERYQIAMATLAIAACQIILPGVTGSRRKKTLKRYATESGINYKRLEEWVSLKLRVWDKLPPEKREKLKIRQATVASRKIGRLIRAEKREPTEKEVIEIYAKEEGDGQHKVYRNASDTLYYLRKAHTLLTQHRTYSGLSDEQRKEVNKFFDEFNRIRLDYSSIFSETKRKGFAGRVLLRRAESDAREN